MDGQDLDKLAVSVLRDVHGKIQATDPCSFITLVNECLLQSTNFEHLSKLGRSIFIDRALNHLLKEGKIVIESSCDYELSGHYITFRQA